MKQTYEPNCDLQGAAADAMLRAIALYKAAGFSRRSFEDAPLNFWESTPAAVPKEKPQAEDHCDEMTRLAMQSK